MPLVLSSILLGERYWLWPAVGVFVLLALAVIGAYLRTGWPSGLRIVATTLKLAGLALLLACLCEPLWSGTRVKPGENLFLVLVDRSASLQVRDGGGAPPRAELLAEALAADRTPWQIRLAQDFDVRRYSFDSRVASVDAYNDLDWSGEASALDGALTTLSDRFRERPVAGVLLFTDGNATDWTAESLARISEFAPVYPVVFEGRAGQTDVALTRVSITQSSFEDAPVTVQADVRATALDDDQLVGRLVSDSGDVVQELRTPPPSNDSPAAFRFQFRPSLPGLSFYSVRVLTAAEAEQDDHGDSDEATTLNNSRLLAVDRGQGPYRVLYVSGRPNWEFKFLRRALEDDPEIDLVGMIRIARKEAKFDFRGRAGESSNPLFSGFKENADEETESYDQPVIVRLGTRDESELRDGFPKTKEQLYEYHAIVLDDVEAGFFSRDQLSLIERFVSERGGGLLMLGGPDSFRHGGYSRTPVGDLLPVYLDRPAEEQTGVEYRLNLTRDGWLQPWIRLRSTEQDEQQRLAEMPGFQTVTRTSQIKPAADILATVRDDDGVTYPALVAHPYGDGRVAAMLIGDLWRWSLRQEVSQPEDLAKSWRQTVRWLVADVPNRTEASVRPTDAGATAAMLVQTRVRDAAFAPLDNASVKVTIHAPGQSPLTLTAEPSLIEPGLFETAYVPRGPGGYRVEVVALDEHGDIAGRDEVGWATDRSADEFREVEVNESLLTELAAHTGGELVRLSDLTDFVETLPMRRAPVTEAWTSPLWHAPWVLLLAIICLTAEWGLRRWRGLP